MPTRQPWRAPRPGLSFSILLAATTFAMLAATGVHVLAGWPLALSVGIPPLATAVLMVAAAFVQPTIAPGGVGAPDGRVFFPGMALAGEQMSLAVLLGGTSAVYAAGFDGLPMAMAAASGLALAALLIAAPMQRLGARDLSSALLLRFGGEDRSEIGSRAAAAVARTVTMLVGVVLMAGILGGGAALLSAIAGLDEVVALTLCALVLAAFVWPHHAHTQRWIAALAFALVTLALIPLLAPFAGEAYGLPVPHLAYGRVLEDIARVEGRLIRSGLIDFNTFRAHAAPFLSLSLANVLALTVVLALGAACQPATLLRAGEETGTRRARRTFVWGLGLMAFTVMLLPAAAAFTKLAVEEVVAKGGGPQALPAWIFEAGRLGLLEICGVAAVDADTVSAACRGIARHTGRLRLHDVSVARDAHLLLLAPATGLSVWAGVIVAALVGAGLVATAAVLHGVAGTRAGEGVTRSRVRRLVVIAVATALAWGAGLGLADGLTWSFSIAAAAVFPVLVLSLWWRRMTAWGACAGMLAGAAVTVYYVLGTRYFAPAFHETWSGLQYAAPPALRRYASLKAALAGADDVMRTAIAADLDRQAQEFAGWWGIKRGAAGIFGLPLALLFAVLVSLASRPPSATAIDPIAPQRSQGR